MIRLLFIWGIASCFASAFEASQLPLSSDLESSFPKLNASCFIIANEESSLVINENNSEKQINTGTFDDFIDFSKLPKLKNSNFIKNTNSFSGNSKSNLLDMCLICKDLDLKSISKNLGGINIIFFKSAMSGFGCAFRFRNANSCNFIIVLYGCSSENEAFKDAKNISKWLNQFFIFDDSKVNVSNTTDIFIKIPILYGMKKSISIKNNPNNLILMSNNCSKRITKTLRYRTILKAPIYKGDVLGEIYYKTDLFKNPVVKKIYSKENIKKTSCFKRIYESFSYIILGSTLYDSRSKTLDID